ncbi:TPA: ATP-binding protein [Escherichia coli]|nr:ATP-binding protein [Escherichia coli]
MHELEVLLSRLKMEHLSYHVENLLEQAAKKELNYREFLCMALQQEWNGRHQRGMESRLKQARLPWVKTLEQFDFTFQPGIDRKVVRELAGLAFVERCENVILLGAPRVGKTHLAIALGVKAVDAGHRVLFMPLDRLIATLMKAKQENRLERQLQQLSYARVLILDEIGYLPMNREVENVVVKNTKVSTTNPESGFMHRDNSSFGVRNRTILYIYARKCTEVSQMVIGRSEHFVQPLRSVS